ncbi:MAG: cell envelope integrity protein CreD [Marinilabiliales bacterium]|nr:cell envelope integrity protein CreD [Marinilabiliales bacterium]
METRSIQSFLNSYSVKMIIVSVLAILLLIPSILIQELVRERMELSDKVKKEIYQQWGGKQVIAGPVLNIPYVVEEKNGKDEKGTERHGVAHFLPETLHTEGELMPETRMRSIYKVVVYQGHFKIQGTFVQPDLSLLDLENARFNWEAAYFTIGLSDVRGIRNMPELVLNGQKCKVEPGVADTDLFPSGITVKAGTVDLRKSFAFSMDLVVSGSEDLSVEALGKTTDVTLKSTWSEPGFTGSFLPVTREVSESGFTASWTVTHLNRNFPQQWVDRKFETHGAKSGVELLIPVDHYQKSMRSAKYAILFIALNFIIFLFMEIRSRKRIHPFQYTLVAFALLIFYSLLISISEQIGFNAAYLISASAVTLLIAWYAKAILAERRMTLLIAGLQAGLYLFLFTILQLQDYALLAGSIGLFLILAFVMHVSRQINWYGEE